MSVVRLGILPQSAGKNFRMRIQVPPNKTLGPEPKGGEDEARGAGKGIFKAKVGKRSKAKERVVAKEEKVKGQRVATPRFRGAGSV